MGVFLVLSSSTSSHIDLGSRLAGNDLPLLTCLAPYRYRIFLILSSSGAPPCEDFPGLCVTSQSDRKQFDYVRNDVMKTAAHQLRRRCIESSGGSLSVVTWQVYPTFYLPTLVGDGNLFLFYLFFFSISSFSPFRASFPALKTYYARKNF